MTDARHGVVGAPATGSFLQRVVARVEKLGPLCAGLDPSHDVLSAWELPDTAEGVRRLCAACMEAFADVVAVVKPQVAFFERHGSAGIEVLEDVLAEAREAGVPVIADAKRCDIANTCKAYADAWLSPQSPLRADAMTAVAFMGLGALEPMIALAERTGRAVLVVARSSNPEGAAVQSARTADGSTLSDHLLREMAERNQRSPAAPLGAVVGATAEASSFPLRELGGVLLAPGLGTQGGSPGDVGRLFEGCPPGTVLPNVSRSLLAAGPHRDALRAAAASLRDDLAAALG
jgi:orotidine-5'-phosphate decarboxylase